MTSVIEHERIVTTVPKAKAARPLVEKMITLAKRDTLHTRRQAAAFLETPAAVKKLFDKLGTRFGQRNGGYTRVVRLGWRKGDGAEQAMLELVGSELVKRAAERAKRREERLKAIQQGKHEEGEEPAENSRAVSACVRTVATLSRGRAVCAGRFAAGPLRRSRTPPAAPRPPRLARPVPASIRTHSRSVDAYCRNATGSPAGRPPLIRQVAIAARLSTPIKTTSVPACR